MGAGLTYKVRVLRLVEDEVDAYGVTATEAMEAAAREPGVARVLDAYFEEASDITPEKWKKLVGMALEGFPRGLDRKNQSD